MFYNQKITRVRVFADLQNFALRAHCVPRELANQAANIAVEKKKSCCPLWTL